MNKLVRGVCVSKFTFYHCVRGGHLVCFGYRLTCRFDEQGKMEGVMDECIYMFVM